MSNYVRISNVSEYLNEISELPANTVFRGEKEFYKESLPSYFRESEEFQNVDIDVFINFMFDYIKHSTHISSELPNTNIDTLTSIEKQHILQHYEMPTKLLDVSKNPLIALYFACVDKDGNVNDKDGYVKAYKLDLLPHNENFEKNSDMHHQALKMPLGSIRAKVQRGDIIYFETGIELPPNAHFEISKENKTEILTELNRMGICFETLFPSLKNELVKLREDFNAMNIEVQKSTEESFQSFSKDFKAKELNKIIEGLQKYNEKNEGTASTLKKLNDWANQSNIYGTSGSIEQAQLLANDLREAITELNELSNVNSYNMITFEDLKMANSYNKRD